LLGGLLYFAGLFRLSALLFGGSGWFLLSVALNSLNPFLLDYLSVARGYGLALGFWVWAVYYLLRPAPAGVIPASVALFLSVVSQPTFLFPSVALVAVFFAGRLAGSLRNRESPGLSSFLRHNLLPFLIAGLALAALIWWGPLQTVRRATHYGEPSFKRSLHFLFDASLIHNATESAVRTGFEELLLWALYVLLWPGLLLLVGQLAKVALRWLLAGGSAAFPDRDRHFLMLAGTAVLTFLLVWQEPRLFHHPYPSPRMLLFLLPLLSLPGLLSLRRFSGPKPLQQAILICAAFPLSVILGEYILHFSVTRYYGWEFDTATKRIAERIRQEHERSPRSQLRIGANWLLQEGLNFYRVAYRMDWMAPVTRDGPECYFDYYAFLEEDRPKLVRFGLEDIYRDGFAGAVLARPGPGILRELRALRELGFQGTPPCGVDFFRLGPVAVAEGGQANGHILRDFLPGEDRAGWRWTAEQPALLFRVKPAGNLKFSFDFVVHSAVIEQAGPVTVSVWINGKLLGRGQYASEGAHTFQSAVPSKFFRADGLALVEWQLDRYFVASLDGQKLGLLFVRAGFSE
jgi:hypothetical protein